MRLRDLGTPGFTWRDLYVITSRLPRDSALVRALEGEDHPWGFTEQLLAATVDALNLANWLQTEDGAKGRRRPKPIPRPGVLTPEVSGGKPVPMDQMADWLGWSTELATPEPVRPVDKVGKPPLKRDARGRFTKN